MKEKIEAYIKAEPVRRTRAPSGQWQTVIECEALLLEVYEFILKLELPKEE